MTALLYILGVVMFVLGLAVSIGLHEVGHMLPAKKFGAKVSQYFVGFGPTIWSRQRGETEYGLKAFPLGGYVKIVGMIPPGDGDDSHVRKSNTGIFAQLISDARSAEWEHVGPGDTERLFYKLPWWKKVIVMAGGPTVNLLIAFFLFFSIFAFHGTPELSMKVDNVAACVPSGSVFDKCTAADPESPAKAAGLRVGDRITAFNGHKVTSYDDLGPLIRGNGDAAATLTVERAGKSVDLTTHTVIKDLPSRTVANKTEKAGYLGYTPAYELQRHGALYTADQMATYTGDTVMALVHLPVKLWGVAKAAVGLEKRADDSPVSVVGVGRISGEIASDRQESAGDRIVTLMSMLASVNLFVAMFNFVPLLPLDGGHIAGALYEGLRRGIARLRRRPMPGPVDVAKLLPVAYVMAGLLLVMSVGLIYADIVAPVQMPGSP